MTIEIALFEGDGQQGTGRKIQNRSGGEAPRLSVSRRYLRRRPDILEYRGVVRRHPGGGAAAQRPAVLSPVRGERGDRVHRLRVGAEPAAGYFGRAGAPSAGEGNLP